MGERENQGKASRTAKLDSDAANVTAIVALPEPEFEAFNNRARFGFGNETSKPNSYFFPNSLSGLKSSSSSFTRVWKRSKR
jgi:hypothetical protein